MGSANPSATKRTIIAMATARRESENDDNTGASFDPASMMPPMSGKQQVKRAVAVIAPSRGRPRARTGLGQRRRASVLPATAALTPAFIALVVYEAFSLASG
jgi:hypothetical protein